MHQSDSIVIIPTYNEKENIEKIIRAVFALDKCFHILIIDDGSPDGTAAIVKVMIANSDWALPISPASNGHWSTTMSISSRWMQTSVMTPTTCRDSMQPVMTRATTWPSARAM